MKAGVIARLEMHLLVLVGLASFFASFSQMLSGFVLALARPAVMVKGCQVNADGCIGYFSVWLVILVGLITLALDIGLWRRPQGMEGRLPVSLALELLLPVGWYFAAMSMGKSDIVGPAWMIFVGPPILLSAAASAVVAWMLVRDHLKPALGVVGSWIERAIALALSLIAGALAYIFGQLVLGQF